MARIMICRNLMRCKSSFVVENDAYSSFALSNVPILYCNTELFFDLHILPSPCDPINMLQLFYSKFPHVTNPPPPVTTSPLKMSHFPPLSPFPITFEPLPNNQYVILQLLREIRIP